MAQNRVLRSASKLGSFSRAQSTADIAGTPDISGDPLAFSLKPALAIGGESAAVMVSPSKKRKVGPRSSEFKNLASETVSIDCPRLLAYPEQAADESLSKTDLPHSTNPTSQLLQKACAHLVQVDPRLQPLIDRHHCHIFSPEGLAEVVNPFQSLCSSIMAQQVSGAAANSIKAKFIELFRQDEHIAASNEGIFPTPAKIAPCEVSFLRIAGLSARKAEYIKGLAQKFVDGELTTAMLSEASDEEIIEKLTAVRGLGLWSVQMFACFALKRTDIFSTGDLGVQRGMALFMGKKTLKANQGGKWKYMSESDMLQHSAKFAPYRSLFMWYMWRVENVDVAAFEDEPK